MPDGDELICKETIPLHRGPIYFADRRLHVTREELAKHRISIHELISKNMRHVSQLGGKNIYLGRPPGDHNRWEHALGAHTVAQIWLKVLYEDKRVPERFTVKPFPNVETAKLLVGYSLLLHDYGHLFFSHLLDEALKSINWVPPHGGESSLEYTVLRDRLEAKDPTTDDLIEKIRTGLSQCGASPPILARPLRYVLSLIQGWSGMPWLQAIVDGPIDADKIDYLRRDQKFLTDVGRPLQTRLYFGPRTEGECELPWLREFLHDQFVNHAGFLCLRDRSALAAADLWRERIYLYDRFYLSPAIRAADRIVLELLQHFLIRCVMSDRFANEVMSREEVKKQFENDRFKGLAELADGSTKAVDVIALKYLAVKDFLTRIADEFGRTGFRDFEVLEFIKRLVLDHQSLDPLYRELLKEGWDQIERLGKGSLKLDKFADDCIVEQPLQFHKSHRDQMREIVRSFQHRYSGDVLIDMVVMPGVLSVPGPPGESRSGNLSNRFAQILVPKGKVSNWGHGGGKLEPLNASKVEELERPIGRVVIVAPGKNKSEKRLRL